MDRKHVPATLDASPLSATLAPSLDSPTDISPSNQSTPVKLSRKRKLSSYSELQVSDDDQDNQGEGATRRPRTSGTKRACNQCRQQKLKCNVVESPWTDCDRCQKHRLRCEITSDFKRVGKRSQQAELEKNNDQLSRKVDELSRQLATVQDQEAELQNYRNYVRQHMSKQDQLQNSGLPGAILQDDESHDAVLLLNLKQGHDLSGPTRNSPAGLYRKLGDLIITSDTLTKLWDEFFRNYHVFLTVLDPEKDLPDVVFERSLILFWTVVVIASRHFSEDPTLLARLTAPYTELVKDTIAKPPSNHYVVKALCLLCTWPLPVSSTTADMTFMYSGVMMKFAMQLGLHRPSHPMDFSRTAIQLREEDITDRLQTWVICNLVAQNISTGYGQPPDTVYDATLNTPLHASTEPYGIYAHLHTRLEIEKLADKITRTVYSPQQHALSAFEEPSMEIKAAMLIQNLQHLETTTDLSAPLNRLYAYAVHLHLRLYVFFEEPTSQRYQLNLDELYRSAKSFLTAAFNCGMDLRYAPNYILQMAVASAVALLKLLNSFFAKYVDVDAGEELFWETITRIRQMSVKTNDLAQRLAEVFAQMWKADADRLENDISRNGTATGHTGSTGLATENGEIDASLALKRRYRMSMSHVFDSIWRWKEDVQGKVRAEKLEAAVQNPTSPQATTHRSSSFSNGRRPSALLLGDHSADLPGMTSFGGFGGLTLSGATSMAYANSYDIFDTVGWYLDGFGGPALDWP